MALGTNIAEFEADLEKFAATIGVEFSVVVRKVVVDLYTRITVLTPVLTGRARASWMLDKDETTDAVAEEGADAIAKNAAQLAKISAIDFNPFVTWWIYNNLPYIVPLEYGHSKKSPAGMVRVALAEIESEIKEYSV